jgi:hypothetical protein
LDGYAAFCDIEKDIRTAGKDAGLEGELIGAEENLVGIEDPVLAADAYLDGERFGLRGIFIVGCGSVTAERKRGTLEKFALIIRGPNRARGFAERMSDESFCEQGREARAASFFGLFESIRRESISRAVTPSVLKKNFPDQGVVRTGKNCLKGHGAPGWRGSR